MITLQLTNIHKTYKAATEVQALRGVDFSFPGNGFVCILGPSGCGKTTLLNIIGGLDRYDDGDLIINGVSTKKYKDADWDAYRNRSIGFVFQNYNLIGHQTVLRNVEIALTISGVSPSERRKRAAKALEDVGLSDQLRKKPNQLSGGQMQRVAIARALVNNPDIILADEPTGSLDSQTSVQVMEILKKISETRLVIMVTHNSDLATTYASRTIQLLDGKTKSDTVQCRGELCSPVSARPNKHTSMSMLTALSLSLNNLLTKRGRTLITAFAGSIGIIGIGLVLALSAGLSRYIGELQTDVLSGFPISITSGDQAFDDMRDINQNQSGGTNQRGTPVERFPGDGLIRRRVPRETGRTSHTNVFSPEYLAFVENVYTALPGAVSNIAYQRGTHMNVLAKGGETVTRFETNPQNFAGGMMELTGMSGIAGIGGGNNYWMELPDNAAFVLSQYDLIGVGSRLPSAANEIAIVVDTFNRLDAAFFNRLGIPPRDTYDFSEFLNQPLLKVIPNDYFYTDGGTRFSAANSEAQLTALWYSDAGLELTVVGILRMKPGVSGGYLSQGIVYTSALSEYVAKTAETSQVAQTQRDSNRNVLTGTMFSSEAQRNRQLIMLGADTTPTGINIYPRDFAAKEAVKEYLESYNIQKIEAGLLNERVIFIDMAELISDMTTTLLDTVSTALIFFAAISLLVSSIMIGIITYVSVLERTKEIGILRSVGARKKDISRVFNAETLIVGFTAGAIGVAFAYIFTFPINMVVDNRTGLSNIADLGILHILLLIGGSMVLTLVAGFLPSKIAARKDPVAALRIE